MLWGKNRGKWKGRQLPGVESRTPLGWAPSVLPLSHNSRTTTSPHNPLYVLHRWYWMPQSHTWQPLNMCHQNSIRGRPENSLLQERTHAEWFCENKINLRKTEEKLQKLIVFESTCIQTILTILAFRCLDKIISIWFATKLNHAQHKCSEWRWCF